jgi:hypothetical protein
MQVKDLEEKSASSEAHVVEAEDKVKHILVYTY